ncbi:MAG: phosphoribosylanthranilate isomerase [Bacteroidota bacterium]
MSPFVKICCISSVEEAHRAIEAGASALGLVSAMPSGPGVIGEDAIAEIAATVPPPISTFLLTSRQDAAGIIEQHQRCRTSVIQLVDAVEASELNMLRDALPGVRLVQVIHVLDETSVEEACSVAPHVDALLLDSGNPNLTVKQLGGTGRTHNWALSRRIVETCRTRVFLAGGLRPHNVAEAINQVRPWGIDLCTGVRTNGTLDQEKLNAFFASVRRAG